MPQLTLDLADELAARFFAERAHVADASNEYTREQMLAFLSDNAEQVVAEIQGMTPEQMAYRLPGAPEGPDESGDEENFDISEIVSHLAVGTAFHWWNLTRALRADRPPIPHAPDGVHVTGKKRTGMGAGGWRGGSAEELSALLRQTVADFSAYVRSVPDDVWEQGRSSFGLFRDMSPHDWLFLVAVHSAMHLNQIRRLKAMPDFPKG
ncbi:MAG TPA: DinB family protein [Chloroflexia bacterium]|nr:DinB family protein [Chloroflexia bacterium]